MILQDGDIHSIIPQCDHAFLTLLKGVCGKLLNSTTWISGSFTANF